MKYLNDLLQESASRWGINGRLATRLFWAPVFATLVIGALQFNRDIFRFLLEEDGPVEWLSAIFFVGTAFVAIRIALHRFKTGHQWQALLFIAAALVMFFAGGEEISWGQRVFGWETPEELLEINDQGETTLHNIGFILQLTNFAMLSIGLHGTVAYLANRRIQVGRFWDQADFLFVPPFFLATYFFPIFGFRVARLTIFTESNFTLNRIGEWAEMLVALGILLFVWLAYERVASPSTSNPISSKPA